VRPERIPLSLRLGPVPDASVQARRFVRDRLTALGEDQLIESAELGVSELVTNACLHARTAITVVLRLVSSGVVRIEVSDESPRQPEQRDHGAFATTGRGLRLLASYGTWGVKPVAESGQSKTIWFQPAVQPHQAFAPPAPSLDDWTEL
jgi:two-component sensor histidine kinase